MEVAEQVRTATPDSIAAPAVEIDVPVLDEIAVLAASVRRLHAYLVESFPKASAGCNTGIRGSTLCEGRPAHRTDGLRSGSTA